MNLAFLNDVKETKKAQAEIHGEGVSGAADFTEYQAGTGKLVHVIISIKGDPENLKPGQHGCHLHEKGLCEAPFTSAGGHFDPGPAGNSDPDVNHPYHMGDLPNLVVNESGEGRLEWLTDRITLSEGPLCILSGEGTCLMVHSNEDHCHPAESKSGMSGGPRAACGVVKPIE